jgi:signal transduction histidine kinase
VNGDGASVAGALPARVRRLAPLLAAAAATTVLLACAATLRIASEPATPLPARILVALVGTAFLLAALLAAPRAPRMGWLLLSLAALFALLEALAVIRGFEDVASGSAWRDLTLLGGLVLVGAVGVAAGYADLNRWDRSRLLRAVVLVVLLLVVATAVAAIWAVVLAARGGPVNLAPGELSPLRFTTRLALVAIVAAVCLGIARDVGPAAVRAAGRLRADSDRDGSDRLWRYLGYLADELVPGRAAGRQRLAETERARLAADLHALVLPDLRRAAAAAATAGAPEEVQLDLRRALEDVEQLMHERQSIVLEEFGLVSALEWLAERTEERAPLRVELDLGASVPEGARAFAPPVARAAFRIALLALDNAVRHANATTATIYVSLDPLGLRLLIQDDGREEDRPLDGRPQGRGEPPAAPGDPGTRTGRGLADMRAEAAASGGEIEIASGTGARIDARWPLDRATGTDEPRRLPSAGR